MGVIVSCYLRAEMYPSGIAPGVIREQGVPLSDDKVPGVRTKIYTFPEGPVPRGVAIDSNGDFVVSETQAGNLVRITPGGVRTVIFSFPGGAASYPHYVAIDSNGDYIVPTAGTDKLFRVTPAGIGTVIFSFPTGTYPIGVAIDSNGDFIVTGGRADKLFPGHPWWGRHGDF